MSKELDLDKAFINLQSELSSEVSHQIMKNLEKKILGINDYLFDEYIKLDVLKDREPKGLL